MDNTVDYVGIGNRIKHRRDEKHITQLQLADLVNCSSNHISTIELAKAHPSLELIIKIAEALETTPDYLLLGLTRSDNTSQELIDSMKLLSPRHLRYAKLWIETLLNNKDID